MSLHTSALDALTWLKGPLSSKHCKQLHYPVLLLCSCQAASPSSMMRCVHAIRLRRGLSSLPMRYS